MSKNRPDYPTDALKKILRFPIKKFKKTRNSNESFNSQVRSSAETARQYIKALGSCSG